MDPGANSRTSASLLGRLGGDPNDAAAWDDFVRRYAPKVRQWCRNWRLQEADAEDVSQNVLLAVARQIRTFRYDPGRSFRGWLKTVARAAWADWLEWQARPGRGSGDGYAALAGIAARDDLVKRLEDEFDRELLDAAIARVRLRVEPQTWEAFRLQALEGLSGARTAEQLGLKVGLVFVAKGRVQKLIQQELQALDPSEDMG